MGKNGLPTGFAQLCHFLAWRGRAWAGCAWGLARVEMAERGGGRLSLLQGDYLILATRPSVGNF
jgi:hypothetical protein